MLMEKIQSHELQNSLPFLVFLVQFLSFQLSSTAYTLPEKYFINCGSDDNVTDARRNFIGDLSPEKSDSFTFTRRSERVIDQSTATPTLYRTARLFRQPSSYEFGISSKGTYLVRLHFFAFTSLENLSTALFDVSSSGIPLLSNLTARSITNPPSIKEFILSISIGKFIIEFVPQGSSFAFVNAIEVFLAPESLIPEVAPHVSSSGSSGDYQGLLSKALHTIYRINVGGPVVTPENDTLWRYWFPDDGYLYNPDTARNSKFYSNKPAYQGGVTEYIAPDFVYQTAKEMNINTSRVSNIFNITWSFNVSKNSRYFVRAHFCDIVSQSLDTFNFNLYIYGNFSIAINPYERISQLAAPFYDDFVVDSDGSGLMNITIGPRKGNQAFLNGLEIMVVMGVLGLVTKTIKPKTHIFLVIGSVLGGFAVICILVVALYFSLRRRKPETVDTVASLPLPVFGRGSSHPKAPERTTNSSVMPNLNLGLKISFPEILLATNNFDAKLRIGRGGFGNVYRGTLRNGMKVAVKRSAVDSGQGFPEFQTEIMVLSKIRHRHLVSLIGYCDERSEMILVYEFMEKGALRDHLYNSTLPSLTWKQRLEICIGAAKGLHYLHSGPSGGFIHRDVKSTNILLDEHYVAKVADFGLSRLGPPDQTHVSTGVKGTIGYLDPDYFRTQQLTEKSDVYSFGVVLLEVLCARPAINNLLPLEQINLAEWAMFCRNRGKLEQIVDPSIKSQINPQSLRKFSETLEKCLQEYGVDRSSMADVMWDLEYALQLQRSAKAHEDSITDGSAVLAAPNARRLPSLSLTDEGDDVPILKEDDSGTSEYEVFSQLMMGDAR